MITQEELEAIQEAIRIINRMTLAPMDLPQYKDLRRMAKKVAPKLPCQVQLVEALGSGGLVFDKQIKEEK